MYIKKRFLLRYYNENTHNITELARACGCSKDNILDLLIEYGIIELPEGCKFELNPEHKPEFEEDDKPRWKSRPGIIYVLKEKRNDKCYKIGMTRLSAEVRCKELQCGNPHRLVVFLWKEVSNLNAAEYRLHKFFGGKRIHGEWFMLDRNDLLELKRIIEEER